MNKVALITGSTSGIGLGIAKHFAKKGYHIMCHGLEANGPEIAEDIKKNYNVNVGFSNANLINANEVEQLVENTIKTLGRIDVLVNNAGIQYVAPIDEFPNSKYEAIIAINMNASFYASKAAWKYMKKQSFGRIINISSVHGLRASEYKTAYVTAKHGVIGMTKVLGLEGAPYNITCNAICPGYVRTPLVEKQIPDQAKSHNMSEEEVITNVMLKKQAVKSFVPIESLADMALLLAKETSSTITGSEFVLDGGWTAQ
ncbi:3-hydroxybutyrate dehydrogenase [Mangrovimonas spongiae]|uniref:3-hydroxybutyrate dehydrogenase n=1 Tax=Mangrovimonas spongiae TaxID=2494697 RepID=A0A3R9MGX6_9FLAO|nr:3-hydroxybutyrate dehydrogenase [Mangrovimonas spongiae]RSK41890.1 3-hydroxybutyrate dehydrogenase [Mangrovimonas spongiae]